jgi:hypothetical protein
VHSKMLEKSSAIKEKQVPKGVNHLIGACFFVFHSLNKPLL